MHAAEAAFTVAIVFYTFLSLYQSYKKSTMPPEERRAIAVGKITSLVGENADLVLPIEGGPSHRVWEWGGFIGDKVKTPYRVWIEAGERPKEEDCPAAKSEER